MIAIRLEAIQAIEDYTFRFDDPSLIQFIGDNSNGKSILVKATARIVFQQLLHDDRRNPLIMRGKQQGRVTYLWDKKALMVTINRSIHSTFYTLLREDGTTITRYAKDQGIDVMLREFGFVIYGKNEVCLQLCETFGLMPFLNTRDDLNLAMVDDVITDIPSENFCKAYQTTYKVASDKLKQVKQAIGNVTYRFDMLHPKKVPEDADALIEHTKKLFDKYDCMVPIEEITIEPHTVFTFDLPLLKPIPAMKLIHWYLPELKSVHNFDLDFEELRRSKNDLDRYISGICPTCGKKVIGGAQ